MKTRRHANALTADLLRSMREVAPTLNNEKKFPNLHLKPFCPNLHSGLRDAEIGSRLNHLEKTQEICHGYYTFVGTTVPSVRRL